MTPKFFEITSPRDMLEKAKRDLDRLKSELDTDTIFNFFVTTYHVMDYVKAQGSVCQSSIDAMYKDKAFQMCNFIANKGKHIKLKKYISTGDPYQTKHKPGALFGAACFGEAMFGEGESFAIIDGTCEIDVIVLGIALISKWETFFLDNGL